jgi:phospholipase C
MSKQPGTCPIQYVVVLMLENRSYDNVLGWLYDTANAPPYDVAPPGQAELDGLAGTESNELPGGGTVTVFNQTVPTQLGSTTSPNTNPTYAATTIPIVDPGEYFGDMAQQITGCSPNTKTPYATYAQLLAEKSPLLMSGFVANYQNPGFAILGVEAPLVPPTSNVPGIMNYLTPAQVPVSAFLANGYGVCDEWFGSVPTQTYPNRSFALCAAPGLPQGASSSYVDDTQYGPVTLLENTASVLSQLDAKAPSLEGISPTWKVYFHDMCIAMKTVPYVYFQSSVTETSNNVNVATFDNSDYGIPSTFVADVTAQPPTLPPFSFIEPRYFSNYPHTAGLTPNSNHPGGSLDPLVSLPALDETPIDVVDGEALLATVYNLLQANDSLWAQTVLIVTYDEHGGVYDHVPPPLAPSPGKTAQLLNGGTTPIYDGDSLNDQAGGGFAYDVYGGRVPAIIVSPMIEQSSTIRRPAPDDGPPYDHTSIIKTVWHLFDLQDAPNGLQSLTGRDLVAASLRPHLLTKTANPTGPFVGAIPTSLQFCSASPAPQTLYGVGPTTATLTAAVTEGEAWLSIATSYPIVTADGELTWLLQITVTATVESLKSGPHPGKILISGAANPIHVPVTLTVA